MGRPGRPALALLPPRRPPIAPVQVTDLHGWNATYGMHRADFVDFLAANLPAGVVHCGHRATGFEQSGDKARVTFANGATVEADAVVAADGIHSELRPYVFPPSKPVFHGTISYRGLVPRERLPDWPMDRWQMWAGPSKHFLVFPVRHGTMVNYVGFVPADEEMKESWSAPGDPDVLRAEFEGWDPRIGAGAEAGRPLLPLGAVRPRAAADLEQGAADAARRRRASDAAASRPGREPVDRGRHGAGDDPGAGGQRGMCRRRCMAYERLRRERVAEVQLGARQNGLRVDSAYTDLGVRDAELAAHADFRKQLYAYDVVPEAKKAAMALA